MRFQLTYDSAFKADYKRETRAHPDLKQEFADAARELAQTGTLPPGYKTHQLTNPNATYTGHLSFHLSDGAVDVVVIYLPHKTNPLIRFVRMGPHDLLFHGPVR